MTSRLLTGFIVGLRENSELDFGYIQFELTNSVGDQGLLASPTGLKERHVFEVWL